MLPSPPRRGRDNRLHLSWLLAFPIPLGKLGKVQQVWGPRQLSRDRPGWRDSPPWPRASLTGPHWASLFPARRSGKNSPFPLNPSTPWCLVLPSFTPAQIRTGDQPLRPGLPPVRKKGGGVQPGAGAFSTLSPKGEGDPAHALGCDGG